MKDKDAIPALWTASILMDLPINGAYTWFKKSVLISTYATFYYPESPFTEDLNIQVQNKPNQTSSVTPATYWYNLNNMTEAQIQAVCDSWALTCLCGNANSANNGIPEIDIQENEWIYQIFGGQYFMMERDGFPLLYFSDAFSFIESINVTVDEGEVNAVYYYDTSEKDGNGNAILPTKRLPRNATTHSRIYLRQNGDIVQVRKGIQVDFGHGLVTVTDANLLDIPSNVRTPLVIHHVLLEYDTEKETGETDPETGEAITETINLTNAQKWTQEREDASKYLSDTNDMRLKIAVNIYENDYIRIENVRIGMIGTIYAEGKTYEDMLLTGIELDTSKSYYTLTFGSYRPTVYKLLKPIKRKKK